MENTACKEIDNLQYECQDVYLNKNRTEHVQM